MLPLLQIPFSKLSSSNCRELFPTQESRVSLSSSTPLPLDLICDSDIYLSPGFIYLINLRSLFPSLKVPHSKFPHIYLTLSSPTQNSLTTSYPTPNSLTTSSPNESSPTPNSRTLIKFPLHLPHSKFPHYKLAHYKFPHSKFPHFKFPYSLWLNYHRWPLVTFPGLLDVTSYFLTFKHCCIFIFWGSQSVKIVMKRFYFAILAVMIPNSKFMPFTLTFHCPFL